MEAHLSATPLCTKKISDHKLFSYYTHPPWQREDRGGREEAHLSRTPLFANKLSNPTPFQSRILTDQPWNTRFQPLIGAPFFFAAPVGQRSKPQILLDTKWQPEMLDFFLFFLFVCTFSWTKLYLFEKLFPPAEICFGRFLKKRPNFRTSDWASAK